jgi:hypothetical protein
MGKRELDEITERLDDVIDLLKEANKPQSLFIRLLNGIATGVGILGALSIVDVIRNWIKGE